MHTKESVGDEQSQKERRKFRKAIFYVQMPVQRPHLGKER